MTDLFRFYVYAYLREDGTPYYIGKGSGDRAYRYKRCIGRPRDSSRIVFLETGLSNIGALALERRFIRWYGRKDIGTGILRNMSDGGDGSDNPSTEHRAKISAANRNRGPYSSETRAKISAAHKGNRYCVGRRQTPETRAKIAAARIGKTFSPLAAETRAKISAAHKGKPKSPETKAKLRVAALARYQAARTNPV